MASRRMWSLLWTLAVAFTTLAIIVALKPEIGGIAPVGSDRIVVVEPGRQDLPRNPDAASRQLSYRRQLDWGAAGSRQYHFVLPVDLATDQGYSVFAPMLGGPSSLYINSIENGDSKPGAFKGPGLGSESLLARVPSNYLKTAFNRVDLVMRSDPHHAGARLVYFGETSKLVRASQGLVKWSAFLHTTLMTGAILGLACSLLGLYVAGRSPLHAGALLIALTMIPILLVGAPRSLEMAMVPASMVGMALCLWGSRAGSARMMPVFRGFVIVLGVATMLRGLLAFSSMHWPDPLLVAHVTNLGLFPMLGIGIPLLLVSDLKGFRARVVGLRRIASEQAALVATKDMQLHEEIRHRAILEERQRFTRDVHDGIGGHMQSLLMRLRMGKIPMAQVESEISKGIADLRLVVDSLDHLGNDLGAAMATFQTRARKQLDAANIDFTCHQGADFGDAKLQPQAILSVYRILQEALTNCVQHAGASRFWIQLDRDAGTGDLSIVIEDDGKGMPQASPVAGRGVRSMQERAGLLRGTLAIGAPIEGSGTRIVLSIPVPPQGPL